MSKQTWTPTEVARLLELRATGYPCGDVAIMLRRTEASVRHKLLAMGYSTQQLDRACRTHKETAEELSAGPALAPIIEKATLAVDRDFERQREREDMETAKRFVLEERIIDMLDAHWSKSPPPNQMPRWLPELPAHTTRDDLHAVALVGDLHMGKVVDPQEVPIVQAYNPALAVVRSAYLLKQWTEALKRRPVKSLYLIFLGDMVEGALGHIVQDHLTPPVAYQFDLALGLLSQFVLQLSQYVPNMHVYGVTGNHGRMFRERKMPASGRWNNFDGLLYRSLDALIERMGAEHVHFHRSIQSRLRIQTPHHSILALHGDEVRGGAFATTGVNREYLHASMRSFHSGQMPPDLVVMGDKHIAAQLPIGTGQCIFNGSFVGTDAFGMGFPPCRPSQTLLYLSPEQQETHIVNLDVLPSKISNPFHFKSDLNDILRQYSSYAILH